MSNKAPEGWDTYELKEIAAPDDRYSFVGGPFGSSLKSEEYTDQGIRIIQLQNIGDGEFKNSYKIYTSPEKADELYSSNIYPGDIILSKMGDPVARAALVPPLESRYVMASDGIRLAVDQRRFDAKFIHDSINDASFRTQAELSSTGTTRKRIGLTTLRQLTLVAPPLPEQQKIAAILASVDDVIEKTRAQIDKLKDLKTGMMQELLTKGIGSGGVPHTEFKDSPVGRIPVSWNVVPCGDVCNKITDGEHLSPKYVDKGLPILSAKDMRDYGIDLEGAKFVSEHDFAKMLKRCKPEYGDVLIVSRGATIGKTTLNTSRTPFALMGSVILLKPNQKCLGEFLSLFIASPFVQQSMLQLSGSSAQQAIYLKDIKDMPTPIPPIAEQKKIAHSITSIDSRIQALTHKLNASERLKKAVMQDLLTGKVRVKIDQKESVVA